MNTTGSVQAADAVRTVIVVTGTGGTDEYASNFTTWANKWESSAKQPGTKVVRIGSGEKEKVSDKDTLKKTIEASIKNNDSELWLVLIGHGTYDGRSARFNLRGPDVTAQDLGLWLLESKMPLAIVNCASSSAPYINALSGPNRVVITATKSGVEQNYARFGGYLSELIANPVADLDKDGQTSLLEAWLMASRQTAEWYSSESRLATEHALLDDNSDMKGSREDNFSGVRPIADPKDKSGKKSLDGYRAHQFCLVPSDRERNMPAELRKQRDALELQVIDLRDRRSDFKEDEYYGQLEQLLVKLAKIYETSAAE